MKITELFIQCNGLKFLYTATTLVTLLVNLFGIGLATDLFTNNINNMWRSAGVSVLSKCGQAFKSVIYYVLVLLVLLCGFFIYW